MFCLSSSNNFLLYRHAVDMRKSFDGLCGIVSGSLHSNPQNGTVYIFINRRRDKVKLLAWESGGFTLYYKRLESGTFELPAFEGDVCRISWPELAMIVSGISLKHIRKRRRYDRLIMNKAG